MNESSMIHYKELHMLKCACRSFASLLVLLSGLAQARADVITFDDISVVGTSLVPPPNGYHGFNWGNILVLNGTIRPDSGYVPGTVSPNNAAFNGGNPASVMIASANVFTFNGAYLTAAFRDNL